MGYEGDENKERGNWTHRLDFILSSLGYAVGLGNIVRFPYLCYRNGGAAFLIPYVCMLVFCGLPLFMLELVVGQFSSESCLTIWKLCPIFKGIGWGMIACSAMFNLYYNVLIGYSVYYMFASFVNMDSVAPWVGCDNDWNTPYCRDGYPDFEELKSNETKRIAEAKGILNLTCTREELGVAPNTFLNDSALLLSTRENCSLQFSSPTGEYWQNHVLMAGDADAIDDLDEMVWKVFVSNLFTWLLIFLCIMKGIKSSGKVVYFTATFPYVMLTILLIRGVTLPGCIDGIKFYIVPTSESWEKLQTVEVWRSAATQIFYSLGPAWGGLITMSSYNRFKNNCYKDAVIIACINCGTSLYGGFAIFSMLGFMAHATNQNIKDVATYGPGLAFIAYPAGISELPGSAVWAFLFFFMLLLLGIDSQFVTVETLISGMCDEFPRLRKRKTLIAFLFCAALFLIGIPMCTKAGIHILTLMDWYSGSYGIVAIALFEIISMAWIYGIRNLSKDFEMMIGYKPNFYWIATWIFFAPVGLTFILVMAGINNSKAYYGNYIYEDWAQGVGWMMVALPIVCIVLGVIIQTIRFTVKEKQGLWHGIKAASRRTKEWGPALNEHRAIDPDRYPPLDNQDIDFKPSINDAYEPEVMTTPL